MTRVVITLDQGSAERRGVPFPIVSAKSAYAASVERAGGTPLFAAPTADPRVRRDLIRLMDALVVTGGDFDIPPERYGQAARGRLDTPKPARTDFEWALLEAALEQNVPVLGICGGMQLLNVVLGGTLVQDIGTDVAGALEHEQPTSPAVPHHPVELTPGCALAEALGRTQIEVNSTHHQAVDRPGPALEVMGRAPDGVIEAIAHREKASVLGVQWHPELLDDDVSRWLYARLVGIDGP